MMAGINSSHQQPSNLYVEENKMILEFLAYSFSSLVTISFLCLILKLNIDECNYLICINADRNSKRPAESFLKRVNPSNQLGSG